MKAHPSPKVTGVTLLIAADPTESFVFDLVTYIVSQLPYLMDQGFSGYPIVTKETDLSQLGIPEKIAGLVGSCILQDIESNDVVTAALKPVNDTIQQRWPGKVQFSTTIEQFDSFLAWFDKNYDMNPAGGSSYLVSRLLDEEALTGDPDALKDALQEELTSGTLGSMATFMVGGKGVQEATPRGGSNAVNPAWRTAYVHACELLQFIR